MNIAVFCSSSPVTVVPAQMQHFSFERLDLSVSNSVTNFEFVDILGSSFNVDECLGKIGVELMLV